LENGRIRAEDFPTAQLNLLRTYPDPSIKQRAVRIFGAYVPRRAAAVESMRNALKLPGSSQRGRQIFVSRCSACHGVGPGPHSPCYVLELNPLQKERLLHTIVEPGVNLPPSAAARVVFSKTGDLWVGRVRNQNKQTITVEQANGSEAVLPQINIAD